MYINVHTTYIIYCISVYKTIQLISQNSTQMTYREILIIEKINHTYSDVVM